MTARPPKTPDKAPGTANGTSIVSAQWQGPLPPPGALEQFDRIIPNGAERTDSEGILEIRMVRR